MKTRSIMIRFPGHSFSPVSFAPDHRLAGLAGSLLEAGHWTQVWDYGTVEGFERLFPPRWGDSVQGLADRWLNDPGLTLAPGTGTLRLSRRLVQAMARRRRELCAEVVDAVEAAAGLDFVVLAVNHGGELPGVLDLARRLRERRPGLRLVATGAWLDRYAEALAQTDCAHVFDCLCVGDRELGLLELAANLMRPEALMSLPNVIATGAGGRQVPLRCEKRNLDALPAPVYSEEVYPALHRSTQLKLFTLEDSRGCGEACHTCTLPAWSEGRVRLRSVRAVCNEVSRLRQAHGARTFRFAGTGTPPFHAEAIAQAMLARRMAVTYNRSLQLCHAEPDIAAALRASGCQACTVRVDTGSQRLLDDYYGRALGVGQAERVLRECVAEGIYTVEQFTYPCPADDYHSREETLRLIQRTRPHAMAVGLPELAPGSNWHTWATEFGFDIHRRRYQRWVLDGCAGFDTPWGGAQNVPYRLGDYSPRKALAENAAVVADTKEHGPATHVSADLALVARVAGHAGQEGEYSLEFLRLCLTGDAIGLATQIERFNARACVSPHSLVCRPFKPALAAVGN